MIVVAARTVLTFACLMVIGSLLMLIFVRPGTGEFVITVVTLLLGALLVTLSGVVLRTAYVRETTMLMTDIMTDIETEIETDAEPALGDPDVLDLPETPLRPSENPRTPQVRTKEEL